MAERWDTDGYGGIVENLWGREVPHLERNLQVLFTGVQQILSEKDPEHKELFQQVFQLIQSTNEERNIKVLPRDASEDIPLEFGFQSMKDLSQTLKSDVVFNNLLPVIYIDETQLFGSSDMEAILPGNQCSSDDFLEVWEQEMSIQQSSTEIAEGNIRDWQEEAQLESISNDPQKARDFVLARFQGRKLAQILLPFAMAVTYYNSVTVADSEKPVEKFLPEGKDTRKISPEALFSEAREPLLFDSFERIYTYWGQRLGYTENESKAVIPPDLQNIAVVGFADFLEAVKNGEETVNPTVYATLRKYFREHSQEDKYYLLMLKMAYNKFIVLRALFYKEFADPSMPQTIGKQLVALWDENTR